MPRLDSIPRSLWNGMAVLIDGSWWLVVVDIGELGAAGTFYAPALRRIETIDAPVELRRGMVASRPVRMAGATLYEAIRPIRWAESDSKAREVDPLRGGLTDDGSLGAYVGEARMLAKAPKRARRKR